MESANITNITIYNIKQTMRKRTLQQHYMENCTQSLHYRYGWTELQIKIEVVIRIKQINPVADLRFQMKPNDIL